MEVEGRRKREGFHRNDAAAHRLSFSAETSRMGRWSDGGTGGAPRGLPPSYRCHRAPLTHPWVVIALVRLAA